MSKRKYFGLATAVLSTLIMIGTTVVSAQAQDMPAPVASYSGTFETTTIDSNADGVVAFRQSVRVLDPVAGDSTVDGINEFAVSGGAGTATCRSGNLGTLLVQLRGRTAPAALVQRFDDGALLFLGITSASACLDNTTAQLFLDAAGQIRGGTGRLAGATGTFRVTGEGSFLYFNDAGLFGPQLGTLEQTVVLPQPQP